jgi:3'-phosphoadenosine 5'-phosphosulfate sulfotransferase (PAPS reductase)/FAD synthetase
MKQLEAIFPCMKSKDFSEDRVRIGLSGGINSAALLCWLATECEPHYRPLWLGLYYCHLREHSPKTARFVFDSVRYARRHFPEVVFGMHRCSAVDFFEAENFIPHPTLSPCTEHLKIEPMERWHHENRCTINLIGFVKHELKRRSEKSIKTEADLIKYPIGHYTEEDCFSIVDREIGWHPPIYDLRDAKGKRLFTHNNCLPCKNMNSRQLQAVADHFPKYWNRAKAMADRINNYWGRDAEFAPDPCSLCTFD